MRLVICDSHRLFADTLGMVMDSAGHQVLACTFTPADGAAAVVAHKPDLCLTELDFPEGEAVGSIATARASSPGTRMVVLSGSKAAGAGLRAKQAGAVAFLSKRRPLSDILSRMNDIGAGLGSFFDGLTNGNGDSESPVTAPRDVLCFLTGREREVLDRLVQGQDTATLAREMGVQYSTARTHIQNVICKLGVHSKLEAVALASSLRPSRAPSFEPRPEHREPAGQLLTVGR